MNATAEPGTSESACRLPSPPSRKRPRAELQVQLICGGVGYTVALIQGAAVAWGDNSIGQCGQPETVLTCHPPRPVPIPVPVHEIAAGCNHTLCRSTTGQVWAWGGNGLGQCGTGVATTALRSPQLVTIPGWPSSGTATRIAAGGWHSVALTASNDVYAWGWGAHGQLGPVDSTAGSAPGVLLAMLGRSELGISLPRVSSGSWIAQLVRPREEEQESPAEMTPLHRLLLWSLIPEAGIHSGLLHTTPQPLHLPVDDSITDISAGLLHTTVRYSDRTSCWGLAPHSQSIRLHLTKSDTTS